MMKVRKKLFTLSGLFMVLAQIFVAAFCGITAIAVTQEETTQSLYSNEYGSAAMSYELLENDRIKWTLTLAKTGQQTATQFMVDLAVDGTSLVPENVTSEGISLIGASSNGHIQAGLSETATTMGGSGTVTFETARAIGTLTATPRLITSVEVPVETSVAAMAAEVTTETPSEETEAVQPAEEPPVQTETVVTNLLDGVGQTTFAIPDVEVVEEIDPVEPTDPNTPKNDGGEVTGTDVVEGEEPGEVTEDEEDEEARNNISNGIFAVEQDDKIESPVEKANRNAKLSSTVSNFTSLKVTKNWEDMTEVIEKAKTVQFRLLRRIKSTGKYENYCTHPESGECDEECNEVYELTYDGSATSVFNWYNLPIYEGEGAERKGPYEYSAVELENSYYETIQNPETPEASVINSLVSNSSNNNLDWTVPGSPTFLVTRSNGAKQWLIWTADHIEPEDRQKFAEKIVEYGSLHPVGTQPYQDFAGLGNYNADNIIWLEGDQDPTGISNGMSVAIKSDSIEEYSVTITFKAKSIWTHFMYGGNSMRNVKVTNTYIPQKNITVQKVWDDSNNGYNTREDIRLELQRYNATLPGDTEDDKWEAVAAHDIGKGTTDSDLFKETFTVPSKVDGETALYRVIEKVGNGEGEYTGDIVPGYATPDIVVTSDETTNNVIYTVTNTLLKANFSFEKVGNDGSISLENVGFTLKRDGGGYEKSATSTNTGSVTFKDLPIGTYTLTETSTVNGYKLGGNWQVSVTDSNNDGVLEVNSPFTYGILANELKPFDLTVNKKDDLGNALVGAEFTLTKQGDNNFNMVLPNDKDPDKNPDPISQFVFKNLTPGTYTLKETKAPDGYALLTKEIKITISSLGVVTVVGATADDIPPLTGGPGNNVISFDVANKKKVPLPATGGSGTMMFVTIGVLALTATGLYFLKRKDQEVA